MLPIPPSQVPGVGLAAVSVSRSPSSSSVGRSQVASWPAWALVTRSSAVESVSGWRRILPRLRAKGRPRLRYRPGVSAICGVVGVDGRAWSAQDLEGARRSIAPLGPDRRGVWTGTPGGCGVALAGALRVGTPEDRHERVPAESADRSLVLVGDLRIDNRDDLAATLGVTDSVGVPDSSFVLAAYARWGADMVDRLVGEFALAIADGVRGGVFLARDAVGARPLCVHERRGVVAFASTALALTEIEGVGHALDVTRAAEVLALAYSSERTLVEGVRWLPGGAAVWIDGSGPRRRTWWKPDPYDQEDLGSHAAHEEALRDALERSVAAQLRSAGSVGAMVSGGLDSTSVAATSARLLAPMPLRTYTSAPPREWSPAWEGQGDLVDESPLVRELARMHPNIDPTFVHVDGAGLLDMHEALWELGAGPARNSANLTWLLAIRRQAAADRVTTLMTGDNGNLFFSAEGPQWLVALLRAGRVTTAFREAQAWRRASGAGWSGIARAHVLPYMMPRTLRRVRRFRGRPSPLDDWLRASPLRPEIASSPDVLKRLSFLDESQIGNRRAHLLGVLRYSASQMDTAAALAALTGVETRDPTVDRRVIEVALRQPEWVRRHHGVDRAAVRGAMADRLPRAILNRSRRGIQLPEWLDLMTAVRADLALELDAVEQHPTSRELIDVERLRSLLDRWPDRSAGGDANVARDYADALLRGLVVSRYLRWFEARAARPKRVTATTEG